MNLTLNTIITPELVKTTKDLGALYVTARWFKEKPRTLKETLSKDPCWILKKIPELQDNREIVLEAVKLNRWSLPWASKQLRDDPEIVLAAVKQNGYSLAYASDRLKDDPEIVLAAVKQYGYSLRYASDRLKDDLEVVLAAAKQNRRALRYASERLQKELAGFKP